MLMPLRLEVERGPDHKLAPNHDLYQAYEHAYTKIKIIDATLI